MTARQTVVLLSGLIALTLAASAQTRQSVVSGVVRDDEGAAIAGAIVTATRVGGIAALDLPALSEPTDGSGRYAFEYLARGNYVFGVTIPSQAAPMPPRTVDLAPGTMIRGDGPVGVTFIDRDARTFLTIAGPVPAAASGRMASLYAPAFHGGPTVLTRAQLVQVDPDRQRAGIDIVLPRRAAVRVAGALTVALPAGYVDPGGPHPLLVRLLPADTPVMPPRGAVSDARPIATALADAAGAFIFPAVPAGEYVIDAYRPMPPPTVQVSPKGLPIFVPADRIDGDPQGMAAAQSITVESDVDQLSLTLRPVGPASRAALEARAARGSRVGPPIGRGTGGTGAGGGRALPGGTLGGGAIAGRLIDADGAPVSGVQILAAQARGSDLLPIGPAAITDGDGRFRLGGLAPGSYAVVAPSFVPGIRAIDYVPNVLPAAAPSGTGKIAYVTTFHPSATDATRATLIEITGQDRDGIDIVLPRVRVTDLSGTIVGGSASEYVHLALDDRRTQLGGRNVLRLTLSAGGGFVFRDVPDGRYTLTYDSPSGWVRAAVSLPESGTGGLLRLSPERHVSISGQVTIAEDAAARGTSLPPGLTVRITPESLTSGDSFTLATVQPDGAFTVMRVVPGRRYFLRAMLTPPWRQTAGSIYGEDAFGAALTITTRASDARIVITNR
jgi:hypothetical protein